MTGNNRGTRRGAAAGATATATATAQPPQHQQGGDNTSTGAVQGTRPRALNGRAAGIAVLVGLWVVLQLMQSGGVVEHRALRCGEQLATAAHNPLQRITVVAEGGTPIVTHLFHTPPPLLDPSDIDNDNFGNGFSNDGISQGEREEDEMDQDTVFVHGSATTPAVDLGVGAHVMQRVCVRRGSRVHYRAECAAPARRVTVVVFDCAAHLGAFADPRTDFTRRRGALARSVVPCGTPATFAATDTALAAAHPGAFVDLCVAARNNVVAEPQNASEVQGNASDPRTNSSNSSGRGWRQPPREGAVLPGVRLHVGAAFVQSDVRAPLETCTEHVCEHHALHAPGGQLLALTQLRGRCTDGDVAVVSTFVWYAPWVHAVAALAAAAAAYALLAIIVPSAFHLVEKNKPKHD